MLIVIPRLTSNPQIYGIYTVCISLNIFFSYADIGFLGAGQKYAAEYFAQKNLNKEIKVIGFVLFLLAILIAFLIPLLLIFAYNPQIIIRSIEPEKLAIGSKLIFILTFSSPIILLQRFNSLVYSIRIEDYIYQKFDIIANLLKVFTIPLFISNAEYDIVNYYLLTQFLTLFGSLIGFIMAIRRYNYKINTLFYCFRYSNEMYLKTKSLAFSSVLLTISWVLFYELDAILLSKFFGLHIVAIYAIGFTFLSFTRNLYNILYSPFLSRFNHFIGNNNIEGLFDSFCVLVKTTFPLCIIPPIVIIYYMPEIVTTWVGRAFNDSILISQVFMLSSIFSAITTPNSHLIIALGQNNKLRFSAIILPIIFYFFLFIFSYSVLEYSLALSKLVTVLSNLIIIVYFCFQSVGIKLFDIYMSSIKKTILPILFLIIYFYIFPNRINITPKSFQSYLYLIQHIIPSISISLLIYYISDVSIRNVSIKKHDIWK